LQLSRTLNLPVIHELRYTKAIDFNYTKVQETFNLLM
jgi:hypothetical protein